MAAPHCELAVERYVSEFRLGRCFCVFLGHVALVAAMAVDGDDDDDDDDSKTENV